MPEISRTTDRALRLLAELERNEAPSAAHLARILDVDRTVVRRLIATLEARGFVRRHDEGHTLDGAVADLGLRVLPRLRQAAHHVVASLAAVHHETAVLHVRDVNTAVVLEQALPTGRLVRVEQNVGSAHSLALGASGRAILLGLEPAVLAHLTREHRELEVATASIDEDRGAGYVISHDELQHGVYGVAAPVTGADASIAILVPSERADAVDRYAPDILAAADAITARLRETAGG